MALFLVKVVSRYALDASNRGHRRLRQEVHDGDPVDGAALRPNMRVFVLAGRNLDNQIEAYRVIWGEILEPR